MGLRGVVGAKEKDSRPALELAVIASVLPAANMILGFVPASNSGAAMKTPIDERMPDLADAAADTPEGDALASLTKETEPCFRFPEEGRGVAAVEREDAKTIPIAALADNLQRRWAAQPAGRPERPPRQAMDPDNPFETPEDLIAANGKAALFRSWK